MLFKMNSTVHNQQHDRIALKFFLARTMLAMHILPSSSTHRPQSKCTLLWSSRSRQRPSPAAPSRSPCDPCAPRGAMRCFCTDTDSHTASPRATPVPVRATVRSHSDRPQGTVPLVLPLGVHVRALREQRRHDLCAVILRREVQCRIPARRRDASARPCA
jgi:hypothetical protein